MSVHLDRFTHEQRIEIANRLCKLILEEYREQVLAVCVYGSTAKKLDRPYSDLEMFVVVRDGNEIPMKKYLFQGLIVGIEYPLESNLLKAASKMGWSLHWEADGYRNRIVLFERDSWLSRLDQAVAVAEKADNTEAVQRSAMNLTEEMAVFQNTLLTDDPLVLKSRGVSLAQAAGDLVLLLNRRFVITTNRFWKQVFECTTKPVDLQELVEVLIGVRLSSKEQLRRCAERLYSKMMEIVVSSGVSLEARDLIVWKGTESDRGSRRLGDSLEDPIPHPKSRMLA